MSKLKEVKPANRRWNHDTYGTYLSGQAAIDGTDHTAIEMERRWGAGRLRLLVSVELRERFDRQDFLYRQAIDHGDLEEVKLQSARMTTAWMALSRAAEAAGASELSPLVWETTLEDGLAVAFVRSHEDARAVAKEGRRLVIYTVEELARMLQNYHEVTTVKLTFPGAAVTAIRRQSIQDPLQAVPDGVSLSDTLDNIDAFRG